MNKNIVILAVEDGIEFSRHYSRQMRLPFRKGWSAWKAYRKEKNGNLTYLSRFNSYDEVEQFLQGCNTSSSAA
ncbi:hypothetical protein ACUN0C_20000 [Faunimonas sp. B44]|uniref:hypothetical protein n=1 Tax=Faunimonas sp. B44 TaxID=3461493 RepID=UPI004043FDB1